MVAWISWSLVAIGIALVILAVTSLSGRARPLRRALRRLSGRQADLHRLQITAEALRERVEDLTAEVQRTADRRDEDTRV